MIQTINPGHLAIELLSAFDYSFEQHFVTFTTWSLLNKNADQ